MLSIKFFGFLFHGVNNFFHDLQALLFISVGFFISSLLQRIKIYPKNIQ